MDDLITSSANPRLKLIRKLRERKVREQYGLFYVEGIRLVAEAIQQGWPIEMLVVAPQRLSSEFAWQHVEQARQKGVRIIEVSAKVFESLALKENPQGLAAVARQRWTPLSMVNPNAGELWVALEAIQDPGNLGTILRTADAVGAKGVILLEHTTDPYDPAAVRASMGAVFTQQLVRTTQEEFLQWCAQTHPTLIGTSDKAHQDYHEFTYPQGLIVMMGSEREGLSPPYAALCQTMVAIPMVGRVDSLNVAIATAIVLYEIFNQRRQRGSWPGLGANEE
ncbi:MAG: TrmH family RNA methyltransferase [Thermanaerothrix sp.]|uniref:RNA methyltransferase n=1 Tax=Thermanaerothrix solaris TaxID=3058434 RepID=A0ABU3NMI0_9CHLR|nr:RNA methyltransferase [Thermanaerothrix sp. 4228-RoL]MDT8897550.1 RNA methyltransferase [Thermanaerothrix sp. 4228-RoL]